MFQGYPRLVQALLGTGFGWFMTAAGAALVWPLELAGTTQKQQQLFLDSALGASAGIMLAASYFSLLAPAIEESDKLWPDQDISWIVASVGFLIGGWAMVIAETYLPDDIVASFAAMPKGEKENVEEHFSSKKGKSSTQSGKLTRRRRSSSRGRSTKSAKAKPSAEGPNTPGKTSTESNEERQRKLQSWRRILLLVIAISLHNAPEGGAVGVAFGALPSDVSDAEMSARAHAAEDMCLKQGCVPKSDGITFNDAWNVAVGIGLQNFPEGLAVSLPLRREGCSLFTAFWWGQLSGMVELVSGFLGAYLVNYVKILLPLALAGAAGAMVYVVCAELIPEAHSSGNGRAVNLGVMLGFTIMMAMDVSLG